MIETTSAKKKDLVDKFIIDEVKGDIEIIKKRLTNLTIKHNDLAESQKVKSDIVKEGYQTAAGLALTLVGAPPGVDWVSLYTGLAINCNGCK